MLLKSFLSQFDNSFHKASQEDTETYVLNLICGCTSVLLLNPGFKKALLKKKKANIWFLWNQFQPSYILFESRMAETAFLEMTLR